jgi:hypothetical protein
MEGKCAICGRQETLTKHHLIPRTRHHNKRNKHEFDRTTVKRTIGICRPCHSQIHAVLTEKQLEREYPTIEKLLTHAEVRKFAEWVATKPRGFRCATRKTDG